MARDLLSENDETAPGLENARVRAARTGNGAEPLVSIEVGMQTILVALDPSIHSKPAALRAGEFAQATGAHVYLAHPFELLQDGSLPSPSSAAGRQPDRLALAALAESLEERGVPISASIRSPDAMGGAQEEQVPRAVDLVVGGTDLFAARSRPGSGAHAENQVGMAARVPVMVVVTENEREAASRIRRILLPTDFSGTASSALALSMFWARALGADIELLHVLPRPTKGQSGAVPMGLQGREAGIRASALESLQEMLTTIGSAGIRAGADLTYGHVPVEIARRAQASKANLVILTKGRDPGLAQPGARATSEDVLSRVNCSVMLAPAEARAAETVAR